MKILALATGETPNGMLTFAVVWENKLAKVKLLRFIDEPMKLSFDDSHVFYEGNIQDVLWYASNLLDTAVCFRRMDREDYDYPVLKDCYDQVVKKSSILLDFDKWESVV